jgi:membrane-associated phospholipid phosphatase
MTDDKYWSRAAGWCLCTTLVAMVGMIAAALAYGLSIRVHWPAALLILSIFAALAFGHRRYGSRVEDRRLGTALGSLLAISAAGSAGGVISQIGQTFAFPTVDSWLLAADQTLGLSSQNLIAGTVAVPGLTSLLAIVYALSIPLILLSVIALSLLGRSERAWELCAAFAFCMVVATVISSLLPAAGPFEFLPIPPDLRSQLPGNAGDYHLVMFHQLRGATIFELDPFRLQGLVTFPSFHTAMALMTIAAWRDDPRLYRPMLLWNLAVICSTVPIGGHYLVDLIGGFASWLLIFRWPSIHAWARRSWPFGPQRISAPA